MRTLINVIAEKEVIHIIRDKRTLALLFLLPLFQVIIFGYAVSVDLKHIATVVLNRDGRYLSRELVRSFINSTYFDIKYYVLERKLAEDLIAKGKVKVIIEIPQDFTRRILRNEPAQINICIDGTDPNPAQTALNTASAICQSFGTKIVVNRIRFTSLVDLRPRVYYNPGLKNSNFMIPGIIGVLLQILIPILTAVTIVREKEKGTLEILITTPVKRYEIILGKLIPYVVIAFIDVVLVLTLGSILFQVKIVGSTVLLLILSFFFLCGSLGLGLFISSISQNQYQAFQMIVPLFPLSVILSGFIFPREGMPAILYGIGYIVPLTYFLKVLRGIILKGIGIETLYTEVIVLAIYTVFCITLSIVTFKKKIQ